MNIAVTGTTEEIFTESFLAFIRASFDKKCIRMKVEVEEELNEVQNELTVR